MPLLCTWDQVAAFRLPRQHLAEPGDDPVAVADRLVGGHAQIASSAEMALGARVPGLTAGDVRAAVAERRTLVKAWGVRETLHLFAPGQLPLVLGALRTSSLYRDAHLKPAWLRYHKVTLEEMQAINAHRRRGARRPRADPRRARTPAQAHTRRDCRRRSRPLGLGCRAQARRLPRRAVLRAGHGPQRHLRPRRP